MITVTDWLRQNKENYSSEQQLRRACMDAMNVTYEQTYYAMRNIKDSSKTKHPIIPIPVPAKVGLSEAQLRAKHDLNFIIQQKVSELKPGQFLTEAEFVRFCNIRGAYRNVLESLTEYRGKAGGITYYSHPESINKMKMEGILQ